MLTVRHVRLVRISRVITWFIITLFISFFVMAKQLTLYECRSDMAKTRNETQSFEGNGRISDTQGDTRILQENTVFVDNPTSSTTIIISNSCSLIFSQEGNSDSDSSQDCVKIVQDRDAGDGHLETTSRTSATDDAPTDIAAGPDKAPVQPKMKFPTTLKGNEYRGFCSEWYKQYRWLEYS